MPAQLGCGEAVALGWGGAGGGIQDGPDGAGKDAVAPPLSDSDIARPWPGPRLSDAGGVTRSLVGRVASPEEGGPGPFKSGINTCDFAAHPDGRLDVAVMWKWCACNRAGDLPSPAVNIWRVAGESWNDLLQEGWARTPSLGAAPTDGLVVSDVGATVRSWDGQSWTPLAPPQGRALEQQAVAIDSSGDLFLVPQSMPPAPRDATVEVRRRHEGIWESRGGPDSGWSSARAVVGVGGVLYVAHDVPTVPDEVWVHRLVGAQWEPVGPAPAVAAVASGFDLALGSDGTLYLGVFGLGRKSIEVLAYRENRWTRLGDPLGDADVEQSFSNAGSDIAYPWPDYGRLSLAAASDGSVFVVRRAKGSAPDVPSTTLMRGSGNAWESIATWDADTWETEILQPRLQTTPDGTVYMLYVTRGPTSHQPACVIERFAKAGAR